MGTSTDAILFYGYCWTEETSKPWTIGKDEDEDEDEGDEDEDEDPEVRYAKAKGLVEPTGQYPETVDKHYKRRTDFTPAEQAVIDEYSVYWDRQRELTKASGCEVGTHCSSECPMPYVAVKESVLKSWRGYMTEINSLGVGWDWDDKLRDYCEVMGIDVSEKRPAWWLVSDWS